MLRFGSSYFRAIDNDKQERRRRYMISPLHIMRGQVSVEPCGVQHDPRSALASLWTWSRTYACVKTDKKNHGDIQIIGKSDSGNKRDKILSSKQRMRKLLRQVMSKLICWKCHISNRTQIAATAHKIGLALVLEKKMVMWGIWILDKKKSRYWVRKGGKSK